MMDSKRSHQQPKRRCPIPILPPRIPTPMPGANNNNYHHARSATVDHHHHQATAAAASLQMTLKQTTSTVMSTLQGASTATTATTVHQATSGCVGGYDERSARFVSKTSYRLLDNDVKTAWINPRLISKIDMEMIRTTEYQVPANIIAERNMNSQYYHNPTSIESHRAHYQPQQQQQQQHYHHHHMASHLKQQQPVHNLQQQQRPAPLGGRDSANCSSASSAAHRHQEKQQHSHKEAVGGVSWWESSSSSPSSSTGQQHHNGRRRDSATSAAGTVLLPTLTATVHSAAHQQQHSAADGGAKRMATRATPLGAPATKPTTTATTMNGRTTASSAGNKLALKYNNKKETVILDAAKQTVVVMEQQQQHAVYRQHVLNPLNAVTAQQHSISNIPRHQQQQQQMPSSSPQMRFNGSSSGRYSSCDVVTDRVGTFGSVTGVTGANGGVFGEGKYSYVSAVEEIVAAAAAIGTSGASANSVGYAGVPSNPQHQQQLQYYPQVAQASAAAAFFARAAQKLNLSSSPHRRKRNSSDDTSATADSSSIAGCSGITPNGFCGVLQRAPPPVPPALLRRIGVKEITGVGKVKVMLRVSTPRQAYGSSSHPSSSSSNSFFSLDKRKKQVTLVDPSCGTTAPEDRRVGVAAPKMFAFDAVFSQDDSQTEVCSSALSELIHAVINGSDGCLFCFGHAGLGKSYTMLGTPESANTLGVIPCAISWLFRGINEQKQKTGARFSVRVSAVEVCGPTNQLRDLLAGYANDSEQSPGVYLRDDPLFGNQPPHCELRVPTAEKAAHYLDAAVDCRNSLNNMGTHGHQRQAAPQAPTDDARDSHLLFTLHVYQYSVAGKGGVAGGRSRLHLIDLGNSERGKASGGIPLSGLGNILLAIFNGQKHLPYKEHKLTHLLKDCLSSLTCHAAMIAHVSPNAQNYTDTLTTVQLASRIHRMRRRKIKFVSAGTGNGSGGSSGEEATRTTGTSSEPDPSSSDLSADTVIYVGPADDPTDGEHPPVYIPSLNSGDNRCAMSKALRGSSAEQRPTRIPTQKPTMHEVASSPMHRSSVKAGGSAGGSKTSSPAHQSSAKSSPARTASNTTPNKVKPQQSVDAQQKHPIGSTSDEQWIDGPRISKSKVAEARHFMKEPCHVKKRETWIDGPMQGESGQSATSAAAAAAAAAGYGYMDTHKKNMIRQWVEHQTSQIQRTKYVTPRVQEPPTRKDVMELLPFKPYQEEEIVKPLDSCKKQDIVEESVIRTGLKLQKQHIDAIQEVKTPEEKEVRIEERKPAETYKLLDDEDAEEEEEQVQIPPALPLIQPLSSREVSLESLDQLLKERLISNAEYNYQSNGYDQEANVSDDEDDIEEHDDDEILEIIEVEEPLEPVPMQDSCLQVTEEDIAFCMGFIENPLPEVDQENPLDHPLRILSQENLTVVSTFTDSMSIYTDLERILPRHRYDLKYGFYNDDYEDPDNPVNNYPRRDEKFEQLARLHELYSNRLAKANVANSETFQKQKQNLKRCESLSLADMLYGVPHDNSSIYSEPAYRPDQEKFCQNCQTSISRPATTQNWYMDPHLSASTTELSNPQEQPRPISGRFQRYTHRHVKDSNLAYLRHPDGASNPNLKEETNPNQTNEQLEPLLQQPATNPASNIITKEPNFTLPLPPPSCLVEAKFNRRILSIESGLMKLTQKSEEYDSGHDSTPRTSKHSPAAISRKAESGYDSVVRDSESSSIDSDTSRLSTHNLTNRRGKCKHKQEKSFCSWFLNPFTCKYIEEPPETHF